MSTLRAWITGIGLWGPGLAGWAAGRDALADPAGRSFDDSGLPQAALLPPAERRRATPATRLSLAVAAEAIEASGLSAPVLPSVFASSAGNPEIIDGMCKAMAEGDHALSPTRFHNSVHNAAAGYYSIAAGSMRASTSLAGGDASAGAGLLEALVQAAAEGEPVLYVSCDLGYPYPLSAVRAVRGEWAVAFVMVPGDAPPARALARLGASIVAEPAPPADLGHDALEAALHENPTGRLLPLLRCLARAGHGVATLPLGEAGHLRIETDPAR